MAYNKPTSGRLQFILALLALAGLYLAPLLSLPGLGSIPDWYQDSFMITCIALTFSGIAIIVAFWQGWFSPFLWTRIDSGVVILTIYVMTRTLLMEDRPQSAWVQITFLPAIYFLARQLWYSINRKGFGVLMTIFLFAGILEAIYGLGQLYGWWPSHHDLFLYTGTFTNPGPYSGWLACLVPVAVYGIVEKHLFHHSNRMSTISWIFLALAILVLIPAASRAAILASAAGCIVLLWDRIKQWTVLSNVWIKSALTLIIIMGLMIMYVAKKDSADGRLLIYKVTSTMVSEKPLFGWGWDGFPIHYNQFQSAYFRNDVGLEREKYLADSALYGFNEYLEFVAEMGLIGLLIPAGITVLCLRKWRAAKKNSAIQPLHRLGLAVLVTWGTFASFSYPLSIPALAIPLPFVFGGTISSFQTKMNMKIGNGTGINSFHPKILISCLIMILVLPSVYWYASYKPIVTSWTEANLYQGQKKYTEANEIYQELLPYLDREGWFLQYAGKSMSLNQQFNISFNLLEKALRFSSDPNIFTTLGMDYTLQHKNDEELMQRAENLLNTAKYISPYKYYPRYLLAQHYFINGQIEKAKEEAENVLAIVPKIASPATNDMRLTMKRLVEQEILEIEKTTTPGVAH